MIKSSVDQIETAIKITRGAMAEAADAVIGLGSPLHGEFRLRRPARS
jgi:hypothetical protein